MEKNNSKITFINHACYLLESNNVGLLVDPWLKGSVFNNGWQHVSKSYFNEQILKKVTHIWYSHEHPDHFSVKDLIDFKNEYKINPIILFQKTKDRRLKNFCNKLGFKVNEIAHWSNYNLSKNFTLTNVRAGRIDSLHIIKVFDKYIVNLNDCVLDQNDLLTIKKSVPCVDILFTQFSYASWIGNKEDQNLRVNAVKDKEDNIKLQLEILKPKNVIPYASFIYFSNEDNYFMNDKIADISQIANLIDTHGSKSVILYPGSVWNIENDFYESLNNIKKYKDDFKRISNLELIKPKKIPLTEIENSGEKYFEKIKKKNNYFLMISLYFISILSLKFLKKDFLNISGLNIKLEDHNISYNFNWKSGLNKINNDITPDLSTSSDMLKFILDNDFGASTLLINARGRYYNNKSLEKFERIFMLGTLNSVEITLKDLIFEKILRTLKLQKYRDKVTFEAKHTSVT